MEFIVDILQAIPSMPLIEFLAGSLAFAFSFVMFFMLVGIKR